MNIVRLDGGLGNQILQYIFSKELSCFRKEIVYLDNSWYHEKSNHNGFELDNVFPNIKLNLLEDLYEKNFWSINVPRVNYDNFQEIWSRLNLDIKLVVTDGTSVTNHVKKSSPISIIDGLNFQKPIFLRISNIYYFGYWFPSTIKINSKIKENLLNELQFKNIIDNKNKNYLNQIKNSISVGIHIRRGDIVGNKNWELKPQNYFKSIIRIKEEIKINEKTPVFFIFSNGLDWVKENLEGHGLFENDSIVYIEGNDIDGKNYIDMQLMSHCKYVVANFRSSFSLCAAILNTNLIEYVAIGHND